MKIDSDVFPPAVQPPKVVDMKRMALLLDVDGTLLDIAATPNSVVVSPCLLTTLCKLIQLCDGALALVSGRTIASLDRLFAPAQTAAVGGHGVELRFSGDSPVLKRFAIPLSTRLRHELHQLVATDRRLFIEDKNYAIAVHYRLAREREPFLRDEIAEAVRRADTDSLEILAGKAVLEVKSRHVSKGLAVSELLAAQAFAGRIPLFIGDDITDESVFAVLPDFGGYGYSVGKLIRGACGTLSSPREVRSWLASLAGGSERAP